MIKVFTTNSCASCRKAIKWLDEHGIKYEEKNIFQEGITKSDIRTMLENTENGFEDIISTRSKAFSDNNLNIDDMTYNELIDFIMSNPSVLRRPIIVDDRKVQIGYNDDDIRVFIPSELRRNIGCSCSDEDPNCEYINALKDCIKCNE